MKNPINIYLVNDDSMSYSIIKGLLTKNNFAYIDFVKLGDNIGAYDTVSIINGLYNGITNNRHSQSDCDRRVLIPTSVWNNIKSYITIPIKVFRLSQNINIEDIVEPICLYKLY